MFSHVFYENLNFNVDGVRLVSMTGSSNLSSGPAGWFKINESQKNIDFEVHGHHKVNLIKTDSDLAYYVQR